MTDQELLDHANDLLARHGELALALAGFLRSSVPVDTGRRGTTVHLIVGTPEWERLLTAANEVTR